MCHTHFPGEGLDQLEMDVPNEKFKVSVFKDLCEFEFTLEELYTVAVYNPWKENYKKGKRSSELTQDDSAFHTCWDARQNKEAHIHRFNEFWRFESEKTGIGLIRFTVGLESCNCHVEFPLDLVLGMLHRSYSSWAIVRMDKEAMKFWYENVYQLTKEADEFWTTIAWSKSIRRDIVRLGRKYVK